MPLPDKCLTCNHWEVVALPIGKCCFFPKAVDDVPATYACTRHSEIFSHLALTQDIVVKIAGIEDGATANSDDAALRDRTTHTGEQPMVSITGLVNDLAVIDNGLTAINGLFAANDTEHATLAADILLRQTASQVDARIATVTDPLATALTTKADLDGGGKIPITQLPALAISDTFPVSSEAEMLALSAERGDTAIRSDVNKTFILRTGSPSVLGNWSEMLTPTDGVFSFNGRSGTVSPTLGDYTPAQVGADPAGSASAAQTAAAIDATTKANLAQAAAIQRANHTGTQSADTLTDGTTNKAFLATEKTKLAGIATNATANASDVQLRDRTTHTGVQPATSITEDTTHRFVTDTQIATWNAGGGGGSSPNWYGNIHAAIGDCDPNRYLPLAQMVGSLALTPTALGITTARIAYFRPPANITVNKIRFFGVGATSAVFRAAIYQSSTLARLTTELPITTAALTWGSIGSGLNLTLTAGTLYFIAVSANATGTTAGMLCLSPTIAATTGQIGVLPGAWPGNLDLDLGFIRGGFAQFAVTAGALPATAPTIAAQAAWTGGFPLFLFDNSNL